MGEEPIEVAQLQETALAPIHLLALFFPFFLNGSKKRNRAALPKVCRSCQTRQGRAHITLSLSERYSLPLSAISQFPPLFFLPRHPHKEHLWSARAASLFVCAPISCEAGRVICVAGWRRASCYRTERGPVPDSLRVCITDWALIKSEASIPALLVLPREEKRGINGGVRAKGWRSNMSFVPTGPRGPVTLTAEHPSALISTSRVKCQKSRRNEDEKR